MRQLMHAYFIAIMLQQIVLDRIPHVLKLLNCIILNDHSVSIITLYQQNEDHIYGCFILSCHKVSQQIPRSRAHVVSVINAEHHG